ncbi:hypothetical protein ACHHYP_10895 [Achlya hypogyna]|uniref:Uncharacterized protein n=1 Tax=Achlya hypogyna TaxID=1202772 RepID=A0A1V9ZHP1_ACHHY|nr:hypothetical protein ACHHYP_10895 [Achlya hypogyna]
MGLADTWYEDLRRQIRALDKAPVQLLLQYLCDGIQEVVMARPHDPFHYMADYLRLAALLVDEPEEATLSRELHKKQIALGRMRNELLVLQARRRKALVESLALEATLFVSNSILTDEDRDFLEPEPRRHQDHWCPHTTPMDFVCQPVLFTPMESGNVGAILEFFVPECMDALVELQKASPEDSVRWLVAHFEAKSPRLQQRAQEVANLKLILGSYRNYYDKFKVLGPQAEIDAHRACSQREDLQTQLAERTRLVTHISVSQLEPRTQLRMTGLPVIVNQEKMWVPLTNIESIAAYSAFQLQALHRAESLLMEADEVRYKAILRFDLEYFSSRKIGAMYRCHRDYARYQIVYARRQAAAVVIQRRYEAYLYHKAVQLPSWCVLGQQVMVAMVLARRAAIWFEFYRGRDFPAGNFATDSNRSLDYLKQRCRLDDKCAAFTSDGSMKRFVPRQLSQLQPFTKGTAATDGLYIKRFPRSDADVVSSAIVTGVPSNKFGTVEIVYDGTGVTELVAVQKLSLRHTREYQFATDNWLYRDQVTKDTSTVAPEPFSDSSVRQSMIDQRKRLYALLQDEAYKCKVERSAIKLQCAFRSKRTVLEYVLWNDEQQFQHILQVRMKELEHQAVVDATAAKVAEKKRKKWRWFRWL